MSASDRYAFYVHRVALRWRLVLREGDPFPGRTNGGQWRRTRSRASDDTNPDVRDEVSRRGYCLFTISASFDELDAELQDRGARPRGAQRNRDR